jgi:hypothetical protein
MPEGVRDFSLLESVQNVSKLNQPPIQGVPGSQWSYTAIRYTFMACTWTNFYFTLPLSKNTKKLIDIPIIKKSKILFVVVLYSANDIEKNTFLEVVTRSFGQGINYSNPVLNPVLRHVNSICTCQIIFILDLIQYHAPSKAHVFLSIFRN